MNIPLEQFRALRNYERTAWRRSQREVPLTFSPDVANEAVDRQTSLDNVLEAEALAFLRDNAQLIDDYQRTPATNKHRKRNLLRLLLTRLLNKELVSDELARLLISFGPRTRKRSLCGATFSTPQERSMS